MQRTKFFPDYLLQNMENFKAKNAEYPLTKDDDNATEFLKKVHDKKLIVKNQVKSIYRVHRGHKDYLCYSLNMVAYDEDKNKIAEFYHVYGWEVFPLIRQVIKGNQEVLEPDGYRIEHNIPFTADEVKKIIKMCDPEYREDINFLVCDVPLDTLQPVNTSRTNLIKSEDIFKAAEHKVIQKIVSKGANEIEDLNQLESFPTIRTVIPSIK